MQPRFKNTLAWEQAQLLMQPAFIRVIDNIRKQLEENTNWQGTYQEVSEPYPGYLLYLSRREYEFKVNIWELCFQVCFDNYLAANTESSETIEVDIDPNLIDTQGELDWLALENKTQRIIKDIFTNLPQN